MEPVQDEGLEVASSRRPIRWENNLFPRFQVLLSFPFAVKLLRRKIMRVSHELRRFLPALFAFAMVALVLGLARAELNPAALQYKLPNQIEWKDTPIGAKMAVMHGDPDKPGPYIVLIKWGPHQMSRPHYHPNDRFITVLSGTWWVGTGNKFDPESTVPMPAGSFVTHFAKGVHYDGSKDGEAIIEIVGEGPATVTPAEAK
jgi:hypothetical protein